MMSKTIKTAVLAKQSGIPLSLATKFQLSFQSDDL